MKYSVSIIGWGDDALSFLDDDDMKCVIIFNDNAPPELQEIAILHTQATLAEDPAPGDTMTICGKKYKITAVGEEAKHTLRELGHCTLTFKNSTEPDRPGCIMLDGEPLVAADIKKGGKIEIL